MPRGSIERHSLPILADAIWVPTLQSTCLHTPGSASSSKRNQRRGSIPLLSSSPLCNHSKQEVPRLIGTIPADCRTLQELCTTSLQKHCHGVFQSSENNVGCAGTWLPSPQLLLLGVPTGAMPLSCRGHKPAAATPCWVSRRPLTAIAAGKTPRAQRQAHRVVL